MKQIQNFVLVPGVQKNDFLDFPYFFTKKIWKSKIAIFPEIALFPEIAIPLRAGFLKGPREPEARLAGAPAAGS